MTIEHWLMIATIISANTLAAATLLAPSLAELVKARLSQPKASPETNQPKNRTQRIGGFLKRHLKSFAVAYVVLLLNISLLIRELSDTVPLTRQSVFAIAFLTSSSVAVLLFITLAGVIKAIAKFLSFTAESFGEYLAFAAKESALSMALFNMIDELGTDIAAVLDKKIPKPASRKTAITIVQEIRDLAILHRVTAQQ